MYVKVINSTISFISTLNLSDETNRNCKYIYSLTF